MLVMVRHPSPDIPLLLVLLMPLCQLLYWCLPSQYRAQTNLLHATQTPQSKLDRIVMDNSDGFVGVRFSMAMLIGAMCCYANTMC